MGRGSDFQYTDNASIPVAQSRIFIMVFSSIPVRILVKAKASTSYSSLTYNVKFLVDIQSPNLTTPWSLRLWCEGMKQYSHWTHGGKVVKLDCAGYLARGDFVVLDFPRLGDLVASYH